MIVPGRPGAERPGSTPAGLGDAAREVRVNEAVLRSFSRVLRLQLGAVQQHFIHVLLLGAWKEEAVADRITSIDAVDSPNAMRIVDCLVSAGNLPALASDREA